MIDRPKSTPNDDLKPSPDQAAAHQFLTELRTRISTQPLPYQDGVEPRALESMWGLFVHAREAIKKNSGCEQFANKTTHVLNTIVRPLTAKWDRAFEQGRLNGRDGADEFRGELQKVQENLRKFAVELHEMAYGTRHKDALTPPVMSNTDMEEVFKPLAFGFTHQTAALKGVAENIRKDEFEAVKARRSALLPAGGNAAKAAPGQDAIGLALSGGGIRSAIFSLGVVQVLAEKGFLKEVDFLSTVSGGGYTGCFLTQRLGNGELHSDVAAPNGPDPAPVRYLRQHAKFLSPNNLKEKWSMVTSTLAGMLLNWTAPLLVLLLLALGVGKLPAIDWPHVLIGSGLLCVFAMVAYGWGMRRGKKFSSVTGTVLGVLLALTVLIGAGEVLERIFPNLITTVREGWGHWGWSGNIGAALAAVAVAVPGIIRFVPVLEDPRIRKLVLKVALMLAGLVMPLIAVLLFYTFRELPEPRDFAGPRFLTLVFITVALAVVSIFVLNINLTAPHRLYRDALARTFIQKAECGTPNVPLADINPQGTAPYHLINAALNVPSSTDFALKDRGCDFFLFSKKWIGATPVGYHPTSDWEANGSPVDLATAMAVSGAAFSSYMGLEAMPTLTALLTCLNVRLGFWIKKPKTGGFNVPGFLCLLREMTGFSMSEKAKWLNLSDGGHIENLAVYELLRRRCKFIICVDGESDPTFTFKGLMTLVRHAQIDFGVCIEAKLDDLRPDPQTGYSKCHFHLCRIYYPEGVGLLLYIKLSVTGNESELIKRYRINNPDFPHQTTLDQFFDQEQFEAYRELGVHAAEGLFRPALMSGVHPASVPEWFRELSKNVLEPNNP